MANAKFWFYPINSPRLVEIDLGEHLGELFWDWEVTQETATTMAGGMFRSTTTKRQVINIQRDRFSLKEDLAVKFAALQTHLDMGYSVAFCSDAARAYCYPIDGYPTTGDSSVQVLGDPFFQMTGGGNLPSVNDYLAIDTPNLAALYEETKYLSATGAFTAANGGQMNLNTDHKIAFSYDRVAFIRYYRFWPMLKRANNIGQNIITNEHGINFSLSLQLTPDLPQLFRFHPLYQGFESTIDRNMIQPGEIINPGNESDHSTLDMMYVDTHSHDLKPVNQENTRGPWGYNHLI